MADWQPIETAPKDGAWFVALPRPELGFCGDPYPPSVCRVSRPRRDLGTGLEDGFDVECKAMNCGSYWELSDFVAWFPLPESGK